MVAAHSWQLDGANPDDYLKHASLSKDHDIPQIEDLLAATKDGATVTKGGQGYEASQVVVTFTDVRKAQASVGKLDDWLGEFSGFTLEVFDKRGSSVQITKANIDKLLNENEVDDLAALLMVL